VRLLVEDAEIVPREVVPPTSAFEIATCSGPREGEVCPLVTTGVCPLGPVDVVVCALDGPWARSVRAAWADSSTPVVDAGQTAIADPEGRLRHHLGAAVQHLWTASVTED
jgi:hypothetical protein